MSFSKVLKAEAVEALRPLRFVEFEEGGILGGVPAPAEEFRTSAPPKVAAKSPPPPPPPGISPAELERVRAEAFAHGRQAGLAEVETTLGETVKAFSAALENLSRLREGLLRNSIDDMLRLVMTVAEQVIACELETNPEVILHVLQNALQAAVRADAYHVRVHPEDFALVQARKPLLVAGINGLKNITFEADPAVRRGGCMIDSELGEVDASIDSQLLEIRQKIRLAVGA